MKKYIILGLCIFNALAGMEQQDIIACHKRESLQAPIFMRLLARNQINIKGIVILHPECSTGVLSAKLAEKADRVRGFDQNRNVINFARATYNRKNLSFKRRHPEEFTTSRLFNLAVIDSYIDDIADKEDLFQRIYNCLPTNNGELFMTISTNDNVLYHRNITAQQMVPHIQKMIDFFDGDQIIDLMINQYPSLQSIHDMLEETGFEIIRSVLVSEYLPMSEKELRELYLPVLMNMAIVEYIPDHCKQTFINQYLAEYISLLEKNDDDKVLEPIITTTIHARKKVVPKKGIFNEKTYNRWIMHSQFS